MIELSVYQLKIKIGAILDLSQIKVLDNSMEMDNRNYQVKIEGGKYNCDPKNPNKFTAQQIATYKIIFLVNKYDGNVEQKECIVEVEDVEPTITVDSKSNILTYSTPQMKLPSFKVSHPCSEFGTGDVITSVRVCRTSFIGNDIDYTVKHGSDGYSVDLLEHGTDNNTQPCGGEYSVIYKAVSPTGLESEKVLTFAVGAEAKAALSKKEKDAKKPKLGKNKINVVIVSLVLVISLVLGVFLSNGVLDDFTNNEGQGTGGQPSTEGTEPETPSTDETDESLKAINPGSPADAYAYGDAYLKTLQSYSITYNGSFYGSKSVAGIDFNINEALSGKQKYKDVVYYTYLNVVKNSNFGGNVYLRTVMPGFDIVLSQMNKSEKRFNADVWEEGKVSDFALFLNRKAGKPYIKINRDTISSVKSFAYNGTDWNYKVELDPTTALAEYNPAIRSMFAMFIDNFSYRFEKVTVTGSVNKYGQPKTINYEIVCDVDVKYKQYDISINNAVLRFSETFSEFNKVTVIEDAFTGPVG